MSTRDQICVKVKYRNSQRVVKCQYRATRDLGNIDNFAPTRSVTYDKALQNQ